MIEIEIANRQSNLSIDKNRMIDAARQVLQGESIDRATISIAVVDDQAIHQLNRRYLNHDYATDVLSFQLDSSRDGQLLGEIVMSAETAIENGARFNLPAGDELLLYVVHATLHLLGYDDHLPEDREKMQQLESRYLAPFGITPHACSQSAHGSTTPSSSAGTAAAKQGETT